MSPARRAEKKLPSSSLHPNYEHGAGKSTMNPSKIHEALANGARARARLSLSVACHYMKTSKSEIARALSSWVMSAARHALQRGV